MEHKRYLALSKSTISAVQGTALEMHAKWGDQTADLKELPAELKLADIVERCGTLASRFTVEGRSYTKNVNRDDWIVRDLLRLAAQCLMWVESLDNGGS
jgi:hypothetical protein